MSRPSNSALLYDAFGLLRCACGAGKTRTLGGYMDVLATIRARWNNTKELPFVVATLCQGGMVAGPILLVFLVFPIVDWTVNGRHMSYRELWASGAGLVFTLFVVLVIAGAWGMAARSLNSRWALVAAPIVPYLASLPFVNSGWIENEDVLPGILSGCLTAAIIYGCLFHLPAMRRYFSQPLNGGDGQAA